MEYVAKKDPLAMKKFFEPLLQHLNVSAIITDDLSGYKQVANGLQLEQQIC